MTSPIREGEEKNVMNGCERSVDTTVHRIMLSHGHIRLNTAEKARWSGHMPQFQTAAHTLSNPLVTPHFTVLLHEKDLDDAQEFPIASSK